GRGLVRLPDAVGRAAIAERLPRDREPVPHGDPVGRAEDGGGDGFGSPPLRVAGRRLVRPPREPDRVGRVRARGALYRGGDGGRVPPHGEPAARDAVARIPRSAAPAGQRGDRRAGLSGVGPPAACGAGGSPGAPGLTSGERRTYDRWLTGYRHDVSR